MKKFVFAALFALLAGMANIGQAAPINFGPSGTTGTFSNGALIDNGVVHFTYNSHEGYVSSGFTGTNIGLNDAATVDSTESGDDATGYSSILTIGSSTTANRISKVGGSTANSGKIGVLVSIDSSIPNFQYYGITKFQVTQAGPASTTTGIAYATYMSGSYSDAYSTTTDANGYSVFGDSVQSVYILMTYDGAAIWNFNLEIVTAYDAPPASVPEPSTLAVFGGIAALGLVAIRRRRQG